MSRELPRSLTVRPVRLQGRLEETRYKKADDGLLYRHEGNADLWLIETKDGRRGTLALPRRGQGWTAEGGTTWLTNGPEKRPMAKRAKKRSKRPAPPGGWKKYMAKIRPNRGRKKMATKGKKRAAPKRSRVVIVNRPKQNRPRRRSSGRRNPPVFSIGGILERSFNGALGGATIVATEIAARMIRGRALGMKAGELLSGATELGITTAAGLLVEKMLGGRAGDRYGQLIVDAGFASIIRATVKGSKAAWVSDALADDTRRQMFTIRDGNTVRLNGYVPGRAPLNGYVGGARPPLGGYVPGNGAAEMAATAAMANRGG